MVEDLIGALAKAFADGTVSPLTLVTLVLMVMLVAVAGALGWALYYVYSGKERQATDHAATMNEATVALTLLTEQLRTLSERQQELIGMASTAGQSAEKSHALLTKIDTTLSVVLRQQ